MLRRSTGTAPPAISPESAPAPFQLSPASRLEAESATWRRERAEMVKQLEELKAKVQELEEEAAQSFAMTTTAAPRPAAADPALPSWLQQGSKQSLAATLPSRRGNRLDDDEATDFKSQLQAEQRKTKRLEKDVQRLSERAQERNMHQGSVGSVPHFEWNDQVELGNQISQGGFSVVHTGIWHGTPVAIKKIFDPKITEELLAEFDNEVQKLEQIRHPNVLMLLAVHRRPPELSFITEIVSGGSMYQFLHSPEKFNHADGPISEVSLGQSLDVLETTAGAIAFLHARGMVHRDIKSQNVLLSPKLDVKLCDFGLARMRSELLTGTMQFAGTPNYMAPEIFRNQKYTENVDVFAFGTMLWEAAACDIPWANFDGADIRDRVLAGKMLEIPRGLPVELQRLIQDCWIADRTTRPPMATVLEQLQVCPRELRGTTVRPSKQNEGGIRPTAAALPAATRAGALAPGTSFR